MKRILCILLLITVYGCSTYKYRCEAENIVYYADDYTAIVIGEDVIIGECYALQRPPEYEAEVR